MPSQRLFIKQVFLIAASSKGRQQKKRKLRKVRKALFKISTKRLRENRKKSKQQKV